VKCIKRYTLPWDTHLFISSSFNNILDIKALFTMSSSSPLPTRQLGKDGPQVTALGFGLMGLSAFYGATESDEERLKFLDYIYASGQRFWDTADMYGDSEDLVGKYVLSPSLSTTKPSTTPGFSSSSSILG
jgi:Aldo/keto reductase family